MTEPDLPEPTGEAHSSRPSASGRRGDTPARPAGERGAGKAAAPKRGPRERGDRERGNRERGNREWGNRERGTGQRSGRSPSSSDPSSQRLAPPTPAKQPRVGKRSDGSARQAPPRTRDGAPVSNFGGRIGQPQPRRGDRGDRPARESSRPQATSYAGRHSDPPLPETIAAKDLDFGARAQLKTLSIENAERVARHLAAAAYFSLSDPALAHRHALAAARTAGRIAVVRETVAITAYQLGDFALALRELRTYRRISGKSDQIALIVDSERGMGRPDRAIEEGRSVNVATLPVEARVALAVALSGARLDLGQPELALSELEIAELNPDTAFSYSPMLFFAYAEVLDELGRNAQAAEWRNRAIVAAGALAEAERGDLIDIDDLAEEFEAESESNDAE